MNYKELKQSLLKMGDPKFRDFSKTLSNSNYQVIGVKNPTLRELIKNHKNDADLRIADFELGQYLEIDFIYFGLALTHLKTIDEQLSFLKENIKFAKSWAITDTLSTYLKKCPFEKYWDLFIDLYQSSYTYDRRLAYVLGLKHYQAPDILKVLSHLNYNEEYMVMMAEAWLLATIALKYPKEVYDVLKSCSDLPLKRKTISKIHDSYRFDDKTKERFQSLR